jgi:hypothetical protein
MNRAKKLVAGALACAIVGTTALSGVWLYAGTYGLNVVLRHGGTWWVPLSTDSVWLSTSMRLALSAAPIATSGKLQWLSVSAGFDVADLPAMVGRQEVDHLLLARIDPARFRFVVLNSSDGDKDLDQWMGQLGAALVVNGSYYARDGKPDTPLISDGVLLGPPRYIAKGGAFVASPSFTGIRDLDHADWQAAFHEAENAMVSYPLLVADGTTRVAHPSRRLANRSFVGQYGKGRIVIGTTTDAFCTLDRFAHFLLDAPLDLTLALNLDGGPVASQGISWNGFDRRTYGRWEAQVEGRRAQLLTWPYGTVAMPVVLAVFPK